jgi:hypothetical protein
MGRKADEFKAAEQIRLQSKKKKKKVAKRRTGPRSARPAVPNQTSHNASQHGAKKARYELELSVTPRPPRKSTRKSGHRQKTDSPLRNTTMSRIAQPSARATRRGGPSKK